jgi:hypothetical protein
VVVLEIARSCAKMEYNEARGTAVHSGVPAAQGGNEESHSVAVSRVDLTLCMSEFSSCGA